MARSKDRQSDSGRPAESSIVAEKELVRPAPLADVASGGVSAAPRYRILRTTEVDPYDPPITAAQVQPFGEAPVADDDFRGTSRKAAKLSIAQAPIERFEDLTDLIATLPLHDEMKNHRPRIATDASSDRVVKERRNVGLRAFLYAASREDDNDYHLIIGRPRGLPAVYMTIEVSGLPPQDSPSFDALRDVRRAYFDFFRNDLPGASYDFYDPPIPIEIEGSLFFDMSHASGSRPGPQSLRDKMPVVWEVHPVSSMVLEP